MKNLKTRLAIFFIASVMIGCYQQKKSDESSKSKFHQDATQVLLVGTFHYNNPGADVAKTKSFDILKEESQKELEFIASKIEEFKPSKIFVEWNYEEQVELDSLFNLYQQGKYFVQDSLSDFYKKNEIFQLAFRTAQKNNLKGVIGIDYGETEFPFDSVMTVIYKSGQTELQSRITSLIETFTLEFDNKIEKGTSLIDLTNYLNSPELRDMSNEFHNEIPLKAGGHDNFIGPFLTAEWYKRNLYMWSMIQKHTNEKDKRIMVLVGASHVAILEQYIDQHDKWHEVSLKSILE